MASQSEPRKARFGLLKKIVLSILRFVLGLAVLLAALWGIFTLIADHQSFVESYYQVQSDKLTSNVRVVQLSDLHLREFGDHNAELIERITALKPDIIAITGDMNDKLVDDYSVVTDLCAALVKIAPVYYVPGNHEWPKIVFDHSPIREDLEAVGVHFLADKTETLEVNGNTIAIGGVAAEAMGVAAFFVADGLVCIALGLTVYLFKSVRALDHDEPHVLRDSAAEANAEIGAVSEEG